MLIISLISSFDIISVVDEGWCPELVSYTPASATHAAAVNPEGIKTILSNGLITFCINGNPVLAMDQVIYQEIFPFVSS